MMQASFQKRVERFKPQLAVLLDVSSEYVEYGIVIRTGIAMNILIHWIKSGKRQTPDDLADTLGMLAKKMITLDQLM